ncbi:lytic transglycosylase domain-containing protein [Brevundimonas sp.]|jgi:hypothetical protein|uniref:lytic transglycosylase domain-containing protein n=1 Tax=Brevundimonas sp. TaxID=1871086 RepID=UPI002E15B01E|nr:transglycosylase SLT domain-containing protein [Brevundimonas sp.]
MLRSPLPSRSLLAALALLAACSDGVAAQVQPERPASASAAVDPVSSAVAEASRRFGVPEHWIRAVMRVESAGRADAVSSAGAMGLMQVMPGTYAELRVRYGLGPDSFAIRDNVLAGTAYLREMFDRYGTTGMLAAYNAGPGRWEEYRAGVRPLPAETVGYLARLGPVLDIAAVPLPPARVTVSAPSPFEAPIFVALHGTSAAVPAPSDERRLRTIVAANTTVVPATGGLFVRRAITEPAPASAPQADAAPSAQSTVAAPPVRPEAATPPAANSLFPARSSREEPR